MLIDQLLRQYAPAICAGLGLILIGIVNLLMARRGPRARTIASIGVVGLCLGLAATFEDWSIARDAALYLAIGILPCVLLGSRRLCENLSRFAARLHAPKSRFGLAILAGLALSLSALLQFKEADKTHVDAMTAELEMVIGRAWAKTDQGTRIELGERTDFGDVAVRAAEEQLLHDQHLIEHVIRRGPADTKSNCFGWVFTGGKFLLVGEDARIILKENGYKPTHAPVPGDLVVYREGEAIRHLGIVRYVASGQAALVESKWGEYGIFLHPVDESMYGKDFTFYHSERKGHLLQEVHAASEAPDLGLLEKLE